MRGIENISNKKIVLTGASSGIGYELLKLLADPKLGNTILAVSQATQTAGFEPVVDADGNVTKTAAAVALDAAFGNLETVEEATLVEWLSTAQNG